MVFITVEAYQSAQVHTITVKNKCFFWVKMKDVQDGLGVKNMPQFIRHEMCGIFETNDLTKEQKNKYIKTEKEISKTLENDPRNCKYARSDIMEKIIKNCRGVTKAMMA